MVSKYYTHVEPKLELIGSWREQGFSEEDIAKKLNIAYSTFRVYKTKYPAFSAELNKTRENLGVSLKKTLYKEAQGYEYEEITEDAELEPVYGKDGKILYQKVIKIKRRKVKKKCRPQQSLLIFALCNLLPNEFQRVDKDIIDNLGEEIEKRVFSSESIQKAFKALYPNKLNQEESKENESIKDK